MISFSKTTPEKAAAVVAKIETKLADARADLERARENYGVASLAVEEGAPNANATKDKALKELHKAQTQVADSEATLSAARARHSEALKTHAEELEEDRWSEVQAIAVQRDQLADEIQKDVKRIALNYDKLVRLGLEQFEIAPKKDVSLQSSSLSPVEVSTSFRQFLFKQSSSFSWAFKWPWGATSIPDFADRISEGNKWLLAQKDRSQKTQTRKSSGQEASSAEDIFS